MFSLDLLRLTPLPDAAGAAVVALAALGLFLLTFEFPVTTKWSQRSRENCPAVTTKQRVLGEGRESASETVLDNELKSLKGNGAPKKRDNPKDFRSEEERDWGKNAPGEIKQRKEKEILKSGSLYPVKDSKTSELDSSGTDELSSSEREDLEDETARCEKERRYRDEQRSNSLGKQKEVEGGNHAVSQPITPSASPSYMERFHSDSFLAKEEQKKIQLAFPVLRPPMEAVFMHQ